MKHVGSCGVFRTPVVISHSVHRARAELLWVEFDLAGGTDIAHLVIRARHQPDLIVVCHDHYDHSIDRYFTDPWDKQRHSKETIL